jgi:hypothetical protein
VLREKKLWQSKWDTVGSRCLWPVSPILGFFQCPLTIFMTSWYDIDFRVHIFVLKRATINLFCAAYMTTLCKNLPQHGSSCQNWPKIDPRLNLPGNPTSSKCSSECDHCFEKNWFIITVFENFGHLVCICTVSIWVQTVIRQMLMSLLIQSSESN